MDRENDGKQLLFSQAQSYVKRDDPILLLGKETDGRLSIFFLIPDVSADDRDGIHHLDFPGRAVHRLASAVSELHLEEKWQEILHFLQQLKKRSQGIVTLIEYWLRALAQVVLNLIWKANAHEFLSNQHEYLDKYIHYKIHILWWLFLNLNNILLMQGAKFFIKFFARSDFQMTAVFTALQSP